MPCLSQASDITERDEIERWGGGVTGEQSREQLK